MTTPRAYLFLLVTTALAVAGCGRSGPPLYTVVGEVKFKDQPVEEGQIVFRPKDARGQAFGATITGGKYRVECTEGLKKVEIVSYRGTGKFKELNPGEKTEVREMYIPKKYNEASELEADVKSSGSNTFDFPLN